MNNISFDNPWLLLVALPLFVAVLVPFCITVRKDNVNFHNVTAMCLNLLVCVCLTLVLAGMTFETVITETNVYVLADISYSSDNNLDEVQENVEKIYKKLPKNSKMGVICFGRNHQLLSELGEPVPNVADANKVDRSATDIGSALRYAGNLFDTDVIKRIIVITDGVETVTSNNIVKVVNNLQNNGVYIDTVYIDNNLPDDVKELQIDAVEASASTYINRDEEVNILVRANCGKTLEGEAERRVDGYVNLYKDGELIERKTASFYNGLNVETITLSTQEKGDYEYRVTVVPVNDDDDTSLNNNEAFFKQNVTDEKKVLYIGTDGTDIEAGMRIYGTEDVTYVTDVTKIPLTVEELCVYDEIAMCNFDIRTLRANATFLASVTTLVTDFGKTFTTYGNTFIQEYERGVTNADNTALNTLQGLLPVNIGNKDQDSRLITLILDISTSMNTSGRLEPAKQISKAIINALSSTDTVMIVGYAGEAKVLLRPTRLTRPSAAIKTIDEEVEPQNHTDLSNALKEAYDLMPSRYHEKQVMIISDGLNPVNDEASSISWAEKMSAEGIAVSAVSVFPESYGDGFLNKLVFNSKKNDEVGFYKKIEHESQIKFVIDSFNEDLPEVKITGDEYQVDIQRPTEEVVKDVGHLNSITGFWCSWTKPSANAVVTAKLYRNRVDYSDVPIYAYWNGGGGKGKVVSFLSDITSDWISGWGNGTDGDKFLSNIPVATLPDERVNTPFAVEVERDDGSTFINVKTSNLIQAGATFEVSVTSPNGFKYDQPLTFNSGEYFAVFSTDLPGTYGVHVEYTYKDVHYETDTSFSVSYYAEYDSFTKYNKSYLYRLLSENGNILELDEIKTIENNDSNYTSYIFDFTIPLFIACAVLFVAGIIIRQLKWKDVVSFFNGLFRRHK